MFLVDKFATSAVVFLFWEGVCCFWTWDANHDLWIVSWRWSEKGFSSGLLKKNLCEPRNKYEEKMWWSRVGWEGCCFLNHPERKEVRKTLFNTLRNLKYASRCLARSPDVLGNAAGAHANSVRAGVGMSAQPQQRSSTGLAGLCVRLASTFWQRSVV